MKTVTILFLQKDNQLLLAMKKRGFGAGKWNGVGGKLEPGETPQAAAIRECQEEIGVTPANPKQVGTITFYDKADPSFCHYAHVYVADEWKGEPAESEEMRPEWFKTTELPYNDMWTADALWLPHVLANEQFEATITFNGEAVESHDIEIAKK